MLICAVIPNAAKNLRYAEDQARTTQPIVTREAPNNNFLPHGKDAHFIFSARTYEVTTSMHLYQPKENYLMSNMSDKFKGVAPAKRDKDSTGQGNQWQVDPRQALFLSNYLEPKSKTFSNAFQSAIKAGYSKEYAEQILSMNTKWLTESMKYELMVKKAERNLDNDLDMEVETPLRDKGELVKDEEGNIVTEMNTELLRIKNSTSKFVTERLKKKVWAQRTEVTGEEGKDLLTPEDVKSRLNKLRQAR